MNSTALRRRAMTMAELSWFDLSKYTAGKLPVAPAGWVPIVAARAHLLTWLRGGHRRQVLDLLPKLQDNPSVDLGIDFLGSRGVNPLDRPSVRLVSIKMLGGMVSNLPESISDPDAGVDEELNKRGSADGPPRFAHVRIDFAATKAQILKDFTRWVDDMRTTGQVTHRPYNRETIAGWVKKMYLPFADLHIFADANGRRISPATYVELLKLPSSESGLDGDVLKPQIRALSAVFNHDTERALHLAAGTTRRAAVDDQR